MHKAAEGLWIKKKLKHSDTGFLSKKKNVKCMFIVVMHLATPS